MFCQLRGVTPQELHWQNSLTKLTLLTFDMFWAIKQAVDTVSSQTCSFWEQISPVHTIHDWDGLSESEITVDFWEVCFICFFLGGGKKIKSWSFLAADWFLQGILAHIHRAVKRIPLWGCPNFNPGCPSRCNGRSYGPWKISAAFGVLLIFLGRVNPPQNGWPWEKHSENV